MRAADRQYARFAWPVALRGDIYVCGALPWGAPASTEAEQEAEPGRPKRAGRRAAPVRMPQSRRDVMRLLASGMDSPHEMARTLDARAVPLVRVSRETGIPYESRKKIAHRRTPNPGVRHVQRLADFFDTQPSAGAQGVSHGAGATEEAA